MYIDTKPREFCYILTNNETVIYFAKILKRKRKLLLQFFKVNYIDCDKKAGAVCNSNKIE